MRNKWYYLIPATMLLLAFLDWDYWFFQLLRWVVCFSAVYIAYQNYLKDNIYFPWAFGIIAVLFNPINPIHLDRDMWAVIDVIVAVFFVFALFKDNTHN